MALIEKTQFSKYEFADWCTAGPSEVILAKSDTSTDPKLRGMRMFHDAVNDKESAVNKRFGGWQNIKTVRVLSDGDPTNGTGTWSLDFILIKPERVILQEKRAIENELARQKAEAEAKERAEQEAKTAAETAAAKAKKVEFKKQRDERLRQLGKKPFQKKSSKPMVSKRNGKVYARTDRRSEQKP